MDMARDLASANTQGIGNNPCNPMRRRQPICFKPALLALLGSSFPARSMSGRGGQCRIHGLVGMKEIGALLARDLERALEALLNSRQRMVDEEELARNRRLQLDHRRAARRNGESLDVADRRGVEGTIRPGLVENCSDDV